MLRCASGTLGNLIMQNGQCASPTDGTRADWDARFLCFFLKRIHLLTPFILLFYSDFVQILQTINSFDIAALNDYD